MTPAEANAILRSLVAAITSGVGLAWAVDRARDGDPVPEAWRCCLDGRTLVDLLRASGHPAEATYDDDDYLGWCQHCKRIYDAQPRRPDADDDDEPRRSPICGACTPRIRALVREPSVGAFVGAAR